MIQIRWLMPTTHQSQHRSSRKPLGPTTPTRLLLRKSLALHVYSFLGTIEEVCGDQDLRLLLASAPFKEACLEAILAYHIQVNAKYIHRVCSVPTQAFVALRQDP